MRLRYFVARRVVSSFVTVIFVIFVSFAILYAGIDREPAQIAAMFNGNHSVFYLFFRYLGNIFTGHWGYLPSSFPFFESFPVAYVMTLLLPDTLQLILTTMVLALLISIPMGTFTGLNRNTTGDMAGRVYSFLFYGMPVIFLSLFFQMLFAKGGLVGTGLPDTGPFSVGLVSPTFLKFGITFPTHVPIIDGLVNLNFNFAWSSFEHLILPSVTLALWTSGALTRFMRNEVIEHMYEPHVNAAKSRGLTQKRIIKRYIRRNSYVPFITMLGPEFALLTGWIVVTETIFGYPGIGTFVVVSAEQFYINGVATGLLVFGIILVALNFISDIVYALLDPRIRY